VLTEKQIADYRRDGYLLLHDVFTAREIDALAAEAHLISDTDHGQRIMENDGELVRSVYGVHLLSDLFDRLNSDARTLVPAQQLLEDELYIHQTQLNPKAPLRGDVWEWHQDFLFWAREDGMPTSRVLNVSLFLDDVTPFNGPIFVIPGSHKYDLDGRTRTTGEGFETTVNADLRHKVEMSALAELTARHGMVSLTGSRGSVLIFESTILHCSPPNLAPYPRTILFVRYNSIHNTLRDVPEPRPTWVACRDPKILRAQEAPLLPVGS
jgi:L-proline 4-hydroxylase